MNLLNSLKRYAAKWIVNGSRPFNNEEIESVETAIVVESEYGNSVCFHMKDGGQCYIPLSKDSTLGVGETVDLSKAILLSLGRAGDEDILRIQI